MSRKLPIFYSALLLTIVNLLLRLVGTSFQVYLSGKIGAEGIGLLQLVMSVGSMALVAGMAGIRTATMYLTAEEIGRKKAGNVIWVLSGSIIYSILCSAAVGIAIYCFAPFLAEKWIGNIYTSDTIRLFGVFLPVNCLTGVMVGYFTGANRIATLAIVEVIEQLFSMVFTLLLLHYWAGHDPEKACQAVVMGSGISACMTLSCLVILRFLEKAKNNAPIQIAGRLAKTAIPLALADDLRTGISTVENLMVPKRLALYAGVMSPLAEFGTVCGMVFPVLMFPAGLLFGLTELLVPELARCIAAGSEARVHYLVRKCLRITLLYSVICAGILFLIAPDLCLALYNNENAGKYLRWFAPFAILLYCDCVTDAMIKGLGQQTASVRYNILTNTMDVILLYALLPRYGIAGYFFSFLITHLINFALSIRRLLIASDQRIDISVPLVTVISACGAVWIAAFSPTPLIKTLSYTIIICCLLFLLKILKKDDILWLRNIIRKK